MEEEFKSDEIPEVEETEEEEVEQEAPSEQEEVEEVIEDEEPPVRRSAKDFIIERQKRKIEKLSKRDDDDLFEEEKPDIEAIISKRVEEALEPFKKTLIRSKDEEELNQALTKYPEAKGLEKQVRKYMENPAYSQVPAEFIVKGILGMRETKKFEADITAKATRQGGRSVRPKEVKEKTAWDMTDEEFEKSVSKVMSNR
jgi:hypothetical protein